MAVIPLVLVVGGKYSAYLMVLPIIAVPIAGKTVRQLVYREETFTAAFGWILFVVVPLSLFTVVAIRYARSNNVEFGRSFVRVSLLLTTWFYFGINFAFFHFPWPWSEWTGRTPSGIIFSICTIGLTLAALLPLRGNGNSEPNAHVAEGPSTA